MSLQTSQFKSQSIVESILKSLLSLSFALASIVLFLLFMDSIGLSYNINEIIKYTITDQLPKSLAPNDIIAFLKNFAYILFWATPLILTGLSVAIAFKCGLFNIGGQGQMIIGGLFAGIFGAVIIPQNAFLNATLNSSPFIMIPTIVIISMVFGAIWGGIPGLLRAYTGAHEVITTIFMNQIAINLANFLVGSNSSPYVDKSGGNVYGQTATVTNNAQILPINSSFSTYLNWSILLVLFLVIITHYVIFNTNFGFKIRATGYNKTASEVSGIDTKKSILYAMLLAGAFAGLAGGLLVIANPPYKYIYGNEGSSGFDGIAVSLIGLNNPIPIIPAAILFGFLRQGRIILDTKTAISSHIVAILQSFVVVFAAAPYLSSRIYKVGNDILHGERNLNQRFKHWITDNLSMIIPTVIVAMLPIAVLVLFGIMQMFGLSTDLLSYLKFLNILRDPQFELTLTSFVAIATMILLLYLTYKYTLNYVSKQKAKSENLFKLVLKLIVLFLIFIEAIILLFYGLVLLSGILINPIRFHQEVLSILFEPVTIRGMIVASFPIIMAAIGGTFNERSGIINIGLEGIMLMSAFGAVFFSFMSGNAYIGILGGILFGLITALLHAILTITFKAEQVVTGVGINLLALGLTDFLTDATWNSLQSVGVAKLPFLNLSKIFGMIGISMQQLTSIPIIGPILDYIFQILSTQSLLLFLGILLIPLCHILLFKTSFGLRLRVIGEEPSAAATAGISVQKYQYLAVLISGFLASIGGVYLSIGDSSFFKSNMTGGRGFTALAAMIFGKWTVGGSVFSGLFFGYFYSLAINLNQLSYFSNIYRLLTMMPFVIAIMVLAGAIGLARPPKSIGKTYDPQD